MEGVLAPRPAGLGLAARLATPNSRAISRDKTMPIARLLQCLPDGPS